MRYLLLLWLCCVSVVQAEEFALTGRLSIRHADTVQQGHLAWVHRNASDYLILTTPLGQGMAELWRDAGQAALRLPDGTEYSAESLEELSARLFGSALPISALADWVCGLAPAAARDTLNRPHTLSENGWQVEWLRYGADNQPELLLIQDENVVLRLRIDEKLPAPTLP